MKPQSYAEKIEEKKRQAAEAVAQLEQEAQIAALLPEGADKPQHIMLGTAFRRAPWICYKVETIQDALALMRLMPRPSEVSARENGCLSIQPPELQGERYAQGKERWTEPCLLEVAQHSGRGFFSCAVGFWVQDFGGLPWAHIKIDVNHLDHRLRASIYARYDWHGNVTESVFSDNAEMRGAATQRIKYGSGSRDSFDVRYYFSGPDHLGDFLQNFKPPQSA